MDLNSNISNGIVFLTRYPWQFIWHSTARVLYGFYWVLFKWWIIRLFYRKVFVKIKTDDLNRFVYDLLKEIGLKPVPFGLDKMSENDKKRTIITVRHSGSRVDSDVLGCCKNMPDSDIKRTVVVIINEFGNNNKGHHGEEIMPSSYEIGNLKTLKGIVTINYRCCIQNTKCSTCKYALDVLKRQAISPN
ncbi:uncharacterized protein LOC132742846 [Ruditapes philippinarum]|uniref:uncharacterized protein LOC132742846 n=1 Tax=Ruditapes philippinarum TaxID=129788 RepID=UPI00295A940F|nr:uncharacterized protein LOC132742846 [Ruditapes philippinarum]